MTAGVITTVEREIKLRFDSPSTARDAVDALGATPTRARRLQDDRLLDWADGNLRRRRCTLRVRIENGVSALTFKGPPQPGLMKVREEIETEITDGRGLLQVFEQIGLIVWFRYQKYREEFVRDHVVIAIDETPIGTFVELEGSEAGITQLAGALGRSSGDYIVDSYRGLFLKLRDECDLPTTNNMVFD